MQHLRHSFSVWSLLYLAAGCAAAPTFGGSEGGGGSVGSGWFGTGGTPATGTGATSVSQPCPESNRLCPHTFTYPAGSESSVSVHGSFDQWGAGVPMTKNGSEWSGTVSNLQWGATLQYKFVLDGTTWVPDPNNSNTVPDNHGGVNSVLAGVTCSEDQWTCTGGGGGGGGPVSGSFDWRDAVLYFVFVDRFVDGDSSNNGSTPSGVEKPASYQGGDWKGVKSKVDQGYFNDLGVNALWLSVPLDNTAGSGLGVGAETHHYSAYHGYWPTNLDKAEEHFGSLADLKALVDAAHAKGIQVVLDYAMNHVHKDSPVYAQHADWFWPLSDGSVQNCTCGGGCDWDDSSQRKRCWFTDYLPDFNFNNADARKYSIDNAIQWVKDTGADGLRLDAVKHIEDVWLTELRSRVQSDIESQTQQHFYLVGETYTGDQGLLKYYVNSSMLDGQFDFPLRAKLIRAVLMRASDTPMSALDDFLSSNENTYGSSAIMSTFVGNHDVPRVIHFADDAPLWGNEWSEGKDRSWSNQPGLPGSQAAFERVANAFTVLMTTKGIPLIYYGDEVGMAGAGDPDNRRMMSWSGYSTGQSLLLGRLQKLGKIRAAHAALRRGARSKISADADTMVFKMASSDDTVYVAVNRSDSARTVSGLPSGSLKDELGGGTVTGPSVSVPARSSLILTP